MIITYEFQGTGKAFKNFFIFQRFQVTELGFQDVLAPLIGTTNYSGLNEIKVYFFLQKC